VSHPGGTVAFDFASASALRTDFNTKTTAARPRPLGGTPHHRHHSAQQAQ
jgi:hypothetical protein